MRRTAALLVLGATLLPAAACTSELSLPDAAQVACGEGEACPEGFGCNEVVGRCLPAFGGDEEPPELVAGSVTITPPVARVDARILVELTVTEPLAFQPEVRLAAGEERLLVPLEHDGLRHSFAYSPTGSEPQGAAIPLTATLVDRSGNVAKALAVGNVEFDFEVPSITGIRPVGNAHLKRGARGVVELTVSEGLREPPTVLLSEGGAPLLVEGESTGPTYRYATTVGDEDDAGSVGVDVTAVDDAGNVGGAHADDVFTLDFTAPTVDDATLPRRPLRASDVVSVLLTLSEAVAVDPVVTMRPPDGDPLELERVLHSPVLFSFLHVVDPSDHGGWELGLGPLSDAAGNTTDPAPLGSLQVDTERPEVLPGATAGPSPLGPGVLLSVTFDVSEPLLEGPEVRVGEALLAQSPESTATHFVFTRSVDAAVEPQGIRRVAATLRDRAGNSSTSPVGEVVYDFTEPALSGTPLLTRCDNRLLARVADDELWVDAGWEEGRPGCEADAPPIEVRFSLGEPTSEDAPISVRVGQEELEALAGSPGSTHFVYGYTPTGEEPECDSTLPDPVGQPVLATLSDQAGNQATLELGRLRFDYRPPGVTTDEAGLARLRYVRDPWGSDPSGYAPRMAVELEADAFDEPGVLRVWAVSDTAPLGADPQGDRYVRAELGSGAFRPGEPLLVEAGSTDHAQVHFTFSDLAGNEADADPARSGVQAFPVASVLWIAGLHGKVVGDATSGPGTLSTASTRAGGSLYLDVQPGEPGDQALHGGAARLGDGRIAAFGTALEPWDDVSGSAAPSERRGHGLVYDERRQRVVLFGGCQGTSTVCASPLGDTWELDGVRWVERRPLTAPPARADHTLVYDARRGRVVLFGGACQVGPVTYLGDTWEWDGSEWRARTPVAAPPARRAAAAAYDEERGRVVLFGGGAMAPGGEVLLLDDTWEWDGDDWVRVTPAAVPPPRRESAATYDSERGTVLVFGGKTWLMDATAPVYGDTWTRSRGRWVEQAPATAPDGRFSTALAFDEDRARAVLFGGCRRWHGPACAEVLADTWEWDGVTWQEQLPPLAPSPRHGHVMAYDARRRRVVLFGGYAALAGTCGEAETQQCSDTWEWDGADWIERHPDTVPPGRTSSALAWDAVRGRSTMVGGYRRHDDLPQEAYADTWDWDGVDWQQLDTPAAPVARYDHGLAFDAARGRLVLYGGIGIDRSAFDDTWEWTEAGWTRRLPGRSAGLREGHVLAYDGFEHGVLLFGGTWMGCRHPLALWDCAETWTRGPAAATPHLVVELDIGASNVLVPSPADRSSRRLLAVAVDVAAGGLGHTWAEDGAEPEAIPGYRVSVSAFGHGGWIPLHTSGAASPAAPAAWGGSFDYDWRCGEPWCEDATIDRWLGTDGRLLLALAPLAPQGASPEHGEIALDYVEVRVAYWRTGCEAPHELNPEGTPDGTPCTDGKLETVEETCRSFECVAR